MFLFSVSSSFSNSKGGRCVACFCFIPHDDEEAILRHRAREKLLSFAAAAAVVVIVPCSSRPTLSLSLSLSLICVERENQSKKWDSVQNSYEISLVKTPKKKRTKKQEFVTQRFGRRRFFFFFFDDDDVSTRDNNGAKIFSEPKHAHRAHTTGGVARERD